MDVRPARAEPLVALVGSGPGNGGLVTLRALACLRRADLVLYDRLSAREVLDHVPPTAECICVTDLAECHPDRAPRVNTLMLEAARAGRRVVRLKGGDPFLFGRGGEEAELLAEAGIPFEIVPGVTAALGAAAYAGLPLTHRQHASAVAFITGHEDPDKESSRLDWEALARFPGTLVFYMGVARLGAVARALMAHGMPADTPTALVRLATLGVQQTVTAPLDRIAEVVAREGLKAPAVTIIGPIVALRDRISWFEKLPLFGHGVLVTRPRHQSAALVAQLESLGATPYLMPTVEIGEPEDWGPVDRALAQLPHYSWLVFTSTNGVHAFVRRLRETGRDLRALGSVQLAVIGPATAEALRSYHLEPDLMPTTYQSEALAEALRPLVAKKRILLARADRGREVLRDILASEAQVDQVAVYAQRDVKKADPNVLEELRQGKIRMVTVTSSNIARSLARLTDPIIHERIRSRDISVVTISAVTSADVQALGWPVAAEATVATESGVIAALLQLAAGW